MARTINRWLVALLSATLALTLASGVALAGKTNGVGGGDDNGNKYGNYHKNDTQTCRDGYSPYYTTTSDYDLNDNNWVCQKWVDGDYFQVDDISHAD